MKYEADSAITHQPVTVFPLRNLGRPNGFTGTFYSRPRRIPQRSVELGFVTWN